MRFASTFLKGISIACLMGATLAAQPATAAEFTDAQKAEIIETVRTFLLENPELLQEMIAAMELKEQAALAEMASRGITDNAKILFRSEADAVLGNPEGDVTVVEFFDYNCGYCKRAHPDVAALLERDKNVRFVYKEFPILGPGSLVASKAAIASKKQGKYESFHNAMMEHGSPLDEDAVFAIAQEQGLDIEKLKQDMEAPEVKAQIEQSYRLAQALGINGTPAYVVGNRLVPGALGVDRIAETVNEVRAAGACKNLC
jgi:protein-disulfide isomerase